MLLTNCLRVIRNAWHFCYALRLSFTVSNFRAISLVLFL
ncbi:DUF3265 domain-containing protein [Vibrio parahaemolyticus]|nr:DUF3265 domain-containing protein [Vibrio parahaemolyticus]MDF5316719.1 DUF3265 domain-containing protein [Vibrio parahaemolyticus]MDF5341100.1 DUF3265 domain-containing protein [Vibrio parahaemolyticus]MDF5351078.1 DUF3265 domain-containing protein [Vibrio parahaemolyticus]MDF5462214.1 DUF3265 domain-containing protein [Vibrio parahaemolyticus]